MYLNGSGGLVVSPTDLVAHLACPHLTTLNREVAEGRRPKPMDDDASADLIRARGDAHEVAVLADMSREHHVAEIPPTSDPVEAEQLTLHAMKAGAARIFQATFYDGRWRGHADFLIRNDHRASALGSWSYNIADTKLARQVKASALLQMAVYAQRLEQLQGTPPETLTVILGNRESVSVPYVDVAAYTRRAMHQYQSWLADPPTTSPVRVGHCAVCRWAQSCAGQWHAEDDLVLVPSLRRDQREAFHDAGITTVEALAAAPEQTLATVRSVAPSTRTKLAQQARLQVAARSQDLPPYQLITPVQANHGLALLPEPDPGDLFLDLEGDPFWGDHGLEYLWGISDARDHFTAWWAHDAEAERRAFEDVVDHILRTWHAHPGMHVYHYAPYEPSRLKSLSQRYATRVDDVDALLRGGRLVDLYAVVRQGLRIGTESYSIKALEQFYDAEARSGASVKDAGTSIVEYERWLEQPDQSILDDIEAYNRDDCISTRRLRDWLEERRAELTITTGPLPRPDASLEGPLAHHAERDPELEAIEAALLADVPEDRDERTPAQQAHALLNGLLEWHRREARADWWEFFRAQALGLDELVDDPAALGELHSPVLVRTEKRSGVWRYTTPPQECRLRVGEQAQHAGSEAETSIVVALDLDLGQVELKRSLQRGDLHPAGLLPGGPIRSGPLETALRRVGSWVAQHGVEADGPYRGVRDLLLGHPPRFAADVPLRLSTETGAQALCRVAPSLTGVLPVQGPPGAGKTYSGSRAVIELLRAGKTVGITALSHRAITNLLDAVMEADDDLEPVVRAVQKAGESSGSTHPRVTVVGTNSNAETALRDGQANLVAGTAWLFAREEIHVDVLVVDEAGQLSLANTVAAGAGAGALILLGDPQQLPQPGQGMHPEGAGVSALEHVLGDHDTVPPEHGLFLDVTWRMHPAVCAPVSELSYDGLLLPREGLEQQIVAGDDVLSGAGIRWVPVPHVSCAVRSDAEADVVASLIDQLTGRLWTDADGTRTPLGPDHLLVVAPYNAQVNLLHSRLNGRARVGTVDRFQGQEAPVVIVSLTTSSAEDAPRGVDFVANRNRLNVAISRARSLAVVVGSPTLLSAPATNLVQLQGINALCRLVEHAQSQSHPVAGHVLQCGDWQ
ncbi:TM0106 family RecB-like putative nuclease [Phytoactinopolyspora mesophila]|uniref:TM0106 family RecB-like putative nuclease n=1 Tax=Phytoactinopolyspora mesophila TaxID=2650750 RepID=A0A7K3MB26_9ACTN|nr:TM0106 family RecB-like putative nuclease [Phytoactinopolyspora mesophila]NDL60370.1 TM0106 family RecB-like putative nuclease [Phytoactinopolyspora mesophila]